MPKGVAEIQGYLEGMLGLESLVRSRPQKALSARFRLGHRKPWESFEVGGGNDMVRAKFGEDNGIIINHGILELEFSDHHNP